MKSLSINSLVIGIGSVIIITFSLLFYNDLTKKVDAGEAEEVGTITFKREVAQRKYTSQVVWEDIEQNAPVYNYDSIRTANLSEAVIHLKDGTEIGVNENSMIMLILAKEKIDIQFSRGSVMTKRGSVTGENIRKLNIKTGNTTVSIEKSDVKISSVRGKDNLTVNRGNARVSTARGDKVVKSDQKVIIGGDNREMRVYDLKLKLKSPSPNSYITESSASRGILFSWQPIRGKHIAFLEVSKDSSFRDLVIRRGVTRDFTTARVKSGIYYWRITAKMVNGKREMSDVRRLSVIRDEAPHLIWPRDGATFVYMKSPPLIHFKWSMSEVANSYQLVISRDPSMKEIVKTFMAPDNSLAINSLSRGIYYWRIDRIANLGDVAQKSSSTIHKLIIDERELLPAPELRYPPDNDKISSLLLKKKSVVFMWKKVQGIPESRLFIASDRELKDIIYSGESKTNFLKIQKELPKGKYYWRVTGYIEGKDATEPSATRAFHVTDRLSLLLVSPADGAILSPEGEKRGIPIRFSWKKSYLKGKYLLEIAHDGSFKDIYRTDRASTYFKVVDDINTGEFFWRVSFLDNDGTVLMSSKPYSFSVRENIMLSPLVIFPRNGEVIDMDDRDELSLRWQSKEEVNFYRVSLYQVKGGSLRLIATEKTEDTSYRIDDLSKLDVGKFRWVLQAFDTYGDSNKKLRKSPEVKVNFIIRLGRSRVKPKIKLPKTLYIE